LIIKNTGFISDLNQFLKTVCHLIDTKIDSEILVAGTFDNIVHKNVLDKILSSRNAKTSKIIIPYVTSNGAISRPYLNKICTGGGQVRINSQFKKDLLVVGEYAFVLSFSYKYSRAYGIKTNFECCMLTSDPETVGEIRKSFLEKWNESFPLSMNEN
jgi:hypothetical protein